MATDIKDFECLVKVVKERHDRYNVNSAVASPVVTPVDPRLHSLYKKVTELIGIDETSAELINLLNNGDDMSKKHLKIVSFVGVGGLGKTTLAKAVYEKLKVEFECCAFVSVGQYPDVKKVLKDILLELDKHYGKAKNCREKYKDIHNLKRDEKQLIDLILEFLDNKRYFIVIDDVWSIQYWEIIRLALVETNLGCRIIDHNHSKLFYLRIISGQGICRHDEMDDVHEKILKKCGGIPLAIIAMASLLAGKQRDQWFNTMKILAFSYYDMPFHLKTCLLYLNVFPEDYIIDKDRLIWMWIAEGFVHAKQQGAGKQFELGEAYFNELMNRSMIQPLENKLEHGMIRGCRLHDMVLGLIRSLSCEENFVTIFHNEQNAFSERQVRRLSFQRRTVGNIPRVEMGMPRIRSLVVYWCSSFQVVPLSRFTVLRVLALEDCPDIKASHLKHLGDLHQLRYLGGNTHLRELPLSIGLIERLLCLRATDLYMEPQVGTIGKLTSLVELQIRAVPDDSESACKYFSELGNLRELRVLKIDNFIHELHANAVDALLESVRNMEKLHHLQTNEWGHALTQREAPGFVLPRHLRHLE
uniref:Uncharacterized protein n=1 Tax=Setaria viridis TaxID=4556 RepID=A0A4U6TJR7_SETVI|nr:hypothetical protein SEVIR_8G137900v2 [Setaria viridis]